MFSLARKTEKELQWRQISLIENMKIAVVGKRGMLAATKVNMTGSEKKKKRTGALATFPYKTCN